MKKTVTEIWVQRRFAHYKGAWSCCKKVKSIEEGETYLQLHMLDTLGGYPFKHRLVEITTITKVLP